MSHLKGITQIYGSVGSVIVQSAEVNVGDLLHKPDTGILQITEKL